jgi:5'-deoxynucleotidase YfbR-like HD superfamily hydrolase
MIWTLYRTGFTQRYHGNAEMAWTGQNNGHHQWGVTVLMMRLFPDEMNLALVWEALHHDTGETGSCDMNSPAKRKYPDAAAAVAEAEWQERFEMGVPEAVLTAREQGVMALCDRLESLLFARVRTPWVLSGDGWPEQRADLLGRAEALGVLDAVEGLLQEAGA